MNTTCDNSQSELSASSVRMALSPDYSQVKEHSNTKTLVEKFEKMNIETDSNPLCYNCAILKFTKMQDYVNCLNSNCSIYKKIMCVHALNGFIAYDPARFLIITKLAKVRDLAYAKTLEYLQFLAKEDHFYFDDLMKSAYGAFGKELIPRFERKHCVSKNCLK